VPKRFVGELFNLVLTEIVLLQDFQDEFLLVGRALPINAPAVGMTIREVMSVGVVIRVVAAVGVLFWNRRVLCAIFTVRDKARMLNLPVH
jgi:hypothetical protein